MGDEIDKHDFVVRMRAFWQFGAERTGRKTDAHAYFGWVDNGTWPELNCEQWFTKCPTQVAHASGEGLSWIMFLANTAGLRPVRMLSDVLWHRARDYLDWHPSTGFVTVAMAIELFPDCSLSLYGFDATKSDREDYWDARPGAVDREAFLAMSKPPHDLLTEKRALAELERGTWLGAPTAVQLHWHCRPSIEGA